MKHTAFSMATMALACMGLAVNAHASNDRHVVGKFTNSTSTVAGGVSTTLDLTVVNDIHNLSFPSHFIEWIQITAPTTGSGALVFTGSGANGAYTVNDFGLPSGWQVSSIAGAVITFNTTLTDFSAGQTRTFQSKVKTPAATACPGTAYTWGLIANQTTSGGGSGNTYTYRQNTALPTVTVSNCVTPTYLVLNSVAPSSIYTTGNSQTVQLTATLTTLTYDNVGNPVAGTPIANEPITFSEGLQDILCNPVLSSLTTNASGVATCTYTPLTAPITPLPAGSY